MPRIPRLWPLFLAIAALGCVSREAPVEVPPKGSDAGAGADAAEDAADEPEAPPLDAGAEADPGLGGPCADDAQCDDAIACTRDACDLALGRCRHTPDDAACQNGVHCDGAELCDLKLGCRAGPPVTCSDGDSCTFDRCDEATGGCAHTKRDADGDGDPDLHCGGGDCDDATPAASSLAPEICANQIDDDCDGEVDEAACTAAAHDACGDALAISTAGAWALDSAGARLDYAATCALSGVSARDVVATVTVPGAAPVDLDLVLEAPVGDVALALLAQCGDASSEIACAAGHAPPQAGRIARVRARGVAPGTYAVVAWATFPTTLTLHVDFRDATPPPSNETCGTAAPLVPGVATIASLEGTAVDLASSCASAAGDLVWTFDLASPSDVRVTAASLDGWGTPSISLRDAGCAMPDDETTCQTAPAPALYARALAAGTWAVRVSATAPTDASVLLTVSAPTPAPPDEACAAPPAIAPGARTSIALAGHVDDVQIGCGTGLADAAYELALPRASDVLFVQRISSGDTGAISLAAPACGAASDLRACGTGAESPLRAAARGVAAGSWRVVAESQLAAPVEVTAFVRDALPPTLVPFADACATAVDVPPGGGFFQGNTLNAAADYSAGCDGAGAGVAGAPDQMLRVVLAKRQRVVADMGGSGYTTLLDVREGPACPGAEVPNGCDVGWSASRSFVDLVLDPGTYWLQVDGYAGGAGPWQMDVRIVDP